MINITDISKWYFETKESVLHLDNYYLEVGRFFDAGYSYDGITERIEITQYFDHNNEKMIIDVFYDSIHIEWVFSERRYISKFYTYNPSEEELFQLQLVDNIFEILTPEEYVGLLKIAETFVGV